MVLWVKTSTDFDALGTTEGSSQQLLFLLTEKDDSKTYELSYGVNPLRIILGIVLPLVIIIIATILIIVGYHQYKRSRKKAGRSENNKKNRKFRLYVSISSIS